MNETLKKIGLVGVILSMPFILGCPSRAKPRDRISLNYGFKGMREPYEVHKQFTEEDIPKYRMTNEVYSR